MAWLFRFLKALAAVLLVLVLVAYALPDRHLVERHRTIARTPAQLWPLLADPRQWPRWSPWWARDPAMRLSYSGAASGLGARWSWDSAVLGRGTVVFDVAQPPVRLGYGVQFAQGMAARGEFRLDAVEAGTRVTWTQESRLGANVLLRWLSPLRDHQLGQDVEQALERLSTVALDP